MKSKLLTKKIAVAFVAVAMLAAFSCKSTTTPETPASTEETISANITADTHWTADKVYTLDGIIVVQAPAVLTIDAGTLIKAKTGSAENVSALVIAVGAKIQAEGTKDKPIIFTSVDDNIKMGEIAGTNLPATTTTGLWGGVILLGDAPISSPTGKTAQVEGVPTNVDGTTFGGDDTTDNSGTLKYVSIRFGGSVLSTGSEINGLTLAGVGNGTTIDHVEIVANSDDGVEFFGGTVNVTNMAVLYPHDDGYDIDQSYAGTIDNIAYVAADDSDHALEIDGPESDSINLTGKFTVQNGFFYGEDSSKATYGDFRNADGLDLENVGAQGAVKDVYFFGFSAKADLELDNDGTSKNFTNRDLTFSGLVFNVGTYTTTLADISDDTAPKGNDNTFDSNFALNNSVGTAKSTGNTFDKAEFEGWTLFSTLTDVWAKF